METYQSIEQAIIDCADENDMDSMYWLFTLDYGKKVTRAAIDWCDVTLEKFITKEES